MYAKTTKSTHYLPRIGSYSTVPHRNGRVDVLPPGASLETFADFEAQLKRALARFKELTKERDLVRAELNAESKRDSARFHEAKRFRRYFRASPRLGELAKQRDEIGEDLNALNSAISDLRRVIKDKFFVPAKVERAENFNTAFVNLARVMLPPDVFTKIFEKAAELAGAIPRAPKLPFHGQSSQSDAEVAKP